ncbi:MAG: 50S ribosomal protein L28 [Candidatus Sericytochromatia bacterium]|nr:50S ribosomal protein L28 [Candidatus Sericytochromatia bacterium]
MGRRCDVSDKGRLVGYSVSHSHRHTKMVQNPNLQYKRFFDPDSGRTVRLRVSTTALKTIQKYGLASALRRYGKKLADLI